MPAGNCKKDNKLCDGESLQCRLNPSETNPVYKDIGGVADSLFYNKKCSNYKKEESE